jgi:hypothetical protein
MKEIFISVLLQVSFLCRETDLSPIEDYRIVGVHVAVCYFLFTECQYKEYGAGCKQKCGHCKDNDPCDKYTGECPLGCEPEYYPPFCQQSECSLYCVLCVGSYRVCLLSGVQGSCVNK